MKKTDKAQSLSRLKQIHLFEDFATDNVRLESILEHTEGRIVKKGEHIITEGELGNTLYLLQNGSVRIIKRTLNEEEYTVVILHDHMHIYFGELALMDSDRRSATVMAETNCELLCLSRRDFLSMAEKDPLLGYRIISQIARKISGSLRKMNTDVITLFEALVSEVDGEGFSL